MQPQGLLVHSAITPPLLNSFLTYIGWNGFSQLQDFSILKESTLFQAFHTLTYLIEEHVL